MDTRQFVEGYRTPANHVVAHRYETLDPEVQDVMEGPRKWASFFDTLVELQLKGEQNDINEPEHLFKELRDYQLGWLEPHLDETLRRGYDIADHSLAHLSPVNELNFHLLNREMMPAWYALFYGQEVAELGPKRIQSMQTRLALRSAELQARYQKYLQAEARSGISSDVTFKIGGQLTEIDAGIVLLEIMKREGHSLPANLLAVPAPPRFEAAHKNKHRAVDFLFFDSLTDQVRGVQVKTAVSNGISAQYDSDYVTVIDGMTDLGNTREAYSSKRGRYSEPAPGLLALDFLMNRTSVSALSRDPTFNGDMATIFRAKEVARSVYGKRKPYLDKAVGHVSERLLHDLYKQKSPEA